MFYIFLYIFLVAEFYISTYNRFMKIDVKHVAKLANIPLKNGEEQKLEKQLSEILNYFEKLKKVDTEKITETSQVTGLENVARDDETKPSLTQEDALSGTESKQNGLFKVDAILEE